MLHWLMQFLINKTTLIEIDTLDAIALGGGILI